ncbi:hypothetical protein HDK77DRAFT_486480 [Phyllosticta capitalensis]
MNTNGVLSRQDLALLQRYSSMRRAFERLRDALRPFWHYLGKMHRLCGEHRLYVSRGERPDWANAASIHHLFRSNTFNGHIVACFIARLDTDRPNCKGLTPAFAKRVLRAKYMLAEDAQELTRRFRKHLNTHLPLLTPRNPHAAATKREMRAGLAAADTVIENDDLGLVLECMRMEWEEDVQPLMAHARLYLTDAESTAWREGTREQRLRLVRAEMRVVDADHGGANHEEQRQRCLQRLQAFLRLDLVHQLDRQRNTLEAYAQVMFELGL